MEEINVTHADLARAFAEWERRYRETPDQFIAEFERATIGLTEYGERAAAHVSGARRWGVAMTGGRLGPSGGQVGNAGKADRVLSPDTPWKLPSRGAR